MTILKPTDLKADLGRILDRATKSPQYVIRNGELLVIKKAKLAPEVEDALVSSWDLRARAIESFYDSAKAW